MWAEIRERHRTEGRLDVLFYEASVFGSGGGLHAAEILRRPHIEPGANRHFGRGDIGARVDGRRGGLELLGDLLLRLAGDAPLHLLSGAWGLVLLCTAPPSRYTASRRGSRSFADCAASGG